MNWEVFRDTAPLAFATLYLTTMLVIAVQRVRTLRGLKNELKEFRADHHKDMLGIETRLILIEQRQTPQIIESIEARQASVAQIVRRCLPAIQEKGKQYGQSAAPRR